MTDEQRNEQQQDSAEKPDGDPATDPEVDVAAEPEPSPAAEPEADAGGDQPSSEETATAEQSDDGGAAEAAPDGEAEAAPDSEAQAAPEDATEAATGPQEGEEPLTPKLLRKRERSRFEGEPKPPRSTADRVSERASKRAASAEQRRRWRRRRREKLASRKLAEPVTPEAPRERAPGRRKVRQGVVVSRKADKTITVRIDAVRRHRVYGKVVRKSGTLYAHDEANQAGEGDVVRVMECRPLSRMKRWRLIEILEKAK